MATEVPHVRHEETVLFNLHRLVLAVVSGPLTGRRFVLTDDVVLIGRTEGAIALGTPTVSRTQAVLRLDVRGYRIEDGGGRNPTLVNGCAVDESVELRPGDRIRVAEHELVLVGDEQQPAACVTLPRQRKLGWPRPLIVLLPVAALVLGGLQISEKTTPAVARAAASRWSNERIPEDGPPPPQVPAVQAQVQPATVEAPLALPRVHRHAHQERTLQLVADRLYDEAVAEHRAALREREDVLADEERAPGAFESALFRLNEARARLRAIGPLRSR